MKNNYLKVLFLLASWLILVACFNANNLNQLLYDTGFFNNEAYNDEYVDDEYYDDEYTDDENYDDASENDTAYDDQYSDASSAEDGDTVNLVRYEIENSTLNQPEYYDLTDSTYSAEQSNTSLHIELWNTAKLVFPDAYEKKVNQVVFCTDGVDNDLASVEPVQELDTSRWTLYIDVLDGKDTTEYTHTLTHELGHLITLKSDQFSGSSGSCSTFETDYGCFSSNSYVTDFINQFWMGNMSEWQDIEYNTTTQEDFDSQIEDFFAKYSDQFVNDYAATHPEEDFAETWLYYVFDLTPEGGSIADQKIAFYESYPELVQIKQEIRKNFN
ncbi:MAG: hypothetical protein JEZ00_15020 [Anaerolineaceae bacterium]|nr:hypothetical protein [Anaerolineaceae bacterium]